MISLIDKRIVPFKQKTKISPNQKQLYNHTYRAYQNRNLPIRAYTYTIPNQSEVKAEYKYTYTTVGDYIMCMTIDENDGGTASSYKYTFEYNFAVK